MVHPHLERLRRMLNTSETQRREVWAKLADAEAKLEESKFAIASLKSEHPRNRLLQAGKACIRRGDHDTQTKKWRDTGN